MNELNWSPLSPLFWQQCRTKKFTRENLQYEHARTLSIKDTLDPFRTLTCCSATIPKLRKGSLLKKRGRTEEKEREREHVTVDGAMRKRESVRDQVENSDSKSRKGVSHLTVSRGVTTLPPRGPARFRSRDARNTMRGRAFTGSQRTTKAILGRRKRGRDIESTVREIERKLVRRFENRRGFFLLPCLRASPNWS